MDPLIKIDYIDVGYGGHQYPNTRNITVDVEVGTITKLFSVEKSEDVKKPNPRIRECQRG